MFCIIKLPCEPKFLIIIEYLGVEMNIMLDLRLLEHLAHRTCRTMVFTWVLSSPRTTVFTWVLSSPRTMVFTWDLSSPRDIGVGFVFTHDCLHLGVLFTHVCFHVGVVFTRVCLHLGVVFTYNAFWRTSLWWSGGCRIHKLRSSY